MGRPVTNQEKRSMWARALVGGRPNDILTAIGWDEYALNLQQKYTPEMVEAAKASKARGWKQSDVWVSQHDSSKGDKNG